MWEVVISKGLYPTKYIQPLWRYCGREVGLGWGMVIGGIKVGFLVDGGWGGAGWCWGIMYRRGGAGVARG